MEAQYIKINEYGDKYYYKDREMTIRHREDGPAIEWEDGEQDWYLNHEKLSYHEFIRRTAPEIVLSMDEIAAKFGVEVSKLRIVK